jgi:hypothetical protein
MSSAMLARKERLEALLSSVRISPQRRRDLVPRLALEWGLTKEKVQEYVDLLLAAGLLEEVKEAGPTVDGIPTSRWILQVVRRRKSLKGVSS